MDLVQTLNQILINNHGRILDLEVNEFYQNIEEYKNFNEKESIIIIGILLNKKIIKETIEKLNISWINEQEKIIIYFAIFAFIFVGDEYNNLELLQSQEIDLLSDNKKIFFDILTLLTKNYSRVFKLSQSLGDDNLRANMFAVNTLLNIKKGLGFDNFHITLFTSYQSLELKLKNCLKKYIELEPTAQKKPTTFHNLVRLIKLIPTSKINDEEMLNVLLSLREYLRYFEKINPGGQAARYQETADMYYYLDSEIDSKVINEKEFFENFIQALSLLQKLYLKIIEIYYSKEKDEEDYEWIKAKIDSGIANLLEIDLKNSGFAIIEQLRNSLDHHIFASYEELANSTYEELLTLNFLIRIGFFKYSNEAIENLLKKD